MRREETINCGFYRNKILQRLEIKNIIEEINKTVLEFDSYEKSFVWMNTICLLFIVIGFTEIIESRNDSDAIICEKRL